MWPLLGRQVVNCTGKLGKTGAADGYRKNCCSQPPEKSKIDSGGIPIFVSDYPLVNVYITMERSNIFHYGRATINGPFSSSQTVGHTRG